MRPHARPVVQARIIRIVCIRGRPRVAVRRLAALAGQAAANIAAHGGRLAEAAYKLALVLFVDEDDHPDADGASLAEQRRAVDPAGAAFLVVVVEVCHGLRQPPDFGRHAARAVGQGGANGGAHA